jgi:pimeloyl-ACP methyl ester carboxylesterase
MGKYDEQIAKVTAARFARGARTLLDGPFAETKELLLGDWPAAEAPRRARRTGYAAVNGLRMYYEVHGSGQPLVLLHGGLTTIDLAFGNVVRALSQGRQVIAIEQQAHGRTADIDRPFSYEQMADDTVELLRQLDLEPADLFGFSMGGAIALQIAVRHPERVRKLAIVSGGYNNDVFEPSVREMFHELGPDSPLPPPMVKSEFERVAATPEQWPAAVARMRELVSSSQGLRRSQLRSVRAPTLFVTGATGAMRLDHTHEMSRIVRASELKIFPGDDHDPAIIARSAALLPRFLDAPPQRTA